MLPEILKWGYPKNILQMIQETAYDQWISMGIFRKSHIFSRKQKHICHGEPQLLGDDGPVLLGHYFMGRIILPFIEV